MSLRTAPSPRIPKWTTGDRIRKARTNARISVGAMAEHLGCDPDTVRNYEADRTRARRPILLAYADVTGVPLVWLETGHEPVLEDEPSQGRRISPGRPAKLNPGRHSGWSAPSDLDPQGRSPSRAA